MRCGEALTPRGTGSPQVVYGRQHTPDGTLLLGGHTQDIQRRPDPRPRYPCLLPVLNLEHEH